jgi:hypothetical protein
MLGTPTIQDLSGRLLKTRVKSSRPKTFQALKTCANVSRLKTLQALKTCAKTSRLKSFKSASRPQAARQDLAPQDASRAHRDPHLKMRVKSSRLKISQDLGGTFNYEVRRPWSFHASIKWVVPFPGDGCDLNGSSSCSLAVGPGLTTRRAFGYTHYRLRDAEAKCTLKHSSSFYFLAFLSFVVYDACTRT